jgi:hypothetical protein
MTKGPTKHMGRAPVDVIFLDFFTTPPLSSMGKGSFVSHALNVDGILVTYPWRVIRFQPRRHAKGLSWMKRWIKKTFAVCVEKAV